jgi:hypothetical protein
MSLIDRFRTTIDSKTDGLQLHSARVLSMGLLQSPLVQDMSALVSTTVPNIAVLH